MCRHRLLPRHWHPETKIAELLAASLGLIENSYIITHFLQLKKRAPLLWLLCVGLPKWQRSARSVRDFTQRALAVVACFSSAPWPFRSSGERGGGEGNQRVNRDPRAFPNWRNWGIVFGISSCSQWLCAEAVLVPNSSYAELYKVQ